GPRHQMLRVPIDHLPALRGQPRQVVQNFTIDPDGSFLYWPDIDVHLGWSQFLQAVDPSELHKAQQRSTDFNRKYGAAIRKVREEVGLRQSEIGGLTDRQLRRIELGQCKAMPNALKALAAAHRLDVNAYMKRLAKAMS